MFLCGPLWCWCRCFFLFGLIVPLNLNERALRLLTHFSQTTNDNAIYAPVTMISFAQCVPIWNRFQIHSEDFVSLFSQMTEYKF